MGVLYNWLLSIVVAFLPVAGLFQSKLRSGIMGRRKWRKRYAAQFEPGGSVLWVHVASLGEFEQGRPFMEAFKKQHPTYRLVVTFFSPSGYELRKGYPLADFVAYLPFDTPLNAKDWVEWLNPSLVVFVKYEIWPNFLFEISRKGIPLYLIAATFRENQLFFKWYGGYFKKALTCFDTIFVQTPSDAGWLHQIGYTNVEVTGDTRVDRVLEIATNAPLDPLVDYFTNGKWTLVIGSSWEPDEGLVIEALQGGPFEDIRVVCAPHVITDAHLQQLEKRLKGKSIRYSDALRMPLEECQQYSWLLIDNIGKLNALYRYGAVAYIGGGFGVGIHNTLEPAAWGLPVLFGPRYQKFEEAKQMIARGAAFSVETPGELANQLQKLHLESERQQAAREVRKYLQESKGATERILKRLNPGV
jgi:3-deoxy-D-manno-octulosonic-acid transferase